MGSACGAGRGERVTAGLVGCREEHFGSLHNSAWGCLGEGQGSGKEPPWGKNRGKEIKWAGCV